MPTITLSATSVGPSGTILTGTIPPGRRRFRVEEAKVRQLAGSAAATTVIVTTDTVSTTPGTCSGKDCVVKYCDLNMATPIEDDNGGNGYVHSVDLITGEFKVHIVPDAGSDNDYEVDIIIGWRF